MLRDLAQEAVANIKRRKLRSLLAISGIVWGTYAVIMLFALGQGYYSASQTNLASINKPTSIVYLRPTSIAYQGNGIGTIISLPINEMAGLSKSLPSIAAVTPFPSAEVSLTSDKQNYLDSVIGVSPDYFQMYDFFPAGRTLNAIDLTQHKQVIYLSNMDKQQLFPNSDPLGKNITISGISFTVVGYTNKPNTWLSQTSIPYTTFSDLFFNRSADMRVLLNPHYSSEQFKQQLMNYLISRYHISPQDSQVIQIWDFTEIAKTVNGIVLAARLFIDFCGIMTLIVGGISIANMLYLLVKERTKEIGIRMAIGAEPRVILLGFVIESFALVLSGALIAMLLSSISLFILHQVHLPDWLGYPSLRLSDIVAIVFILVITAVIAGITPARYAANLQPVEALLARG